METADGKPKALSAGSLSRAQCSVCGFGTWRTSTKTSPRWSLSRVKKCSSAAASTRCWRESTGGGVPVDDLLWFSGITWHTQLRDIGWTYVTALALAAFAVYYVRKAFRGD